MIDSHCHLADEIFAPDLDAVVGRAQAAGVTAALCILSADEPAEVARAGIVSRAWPSVRFAAAIHPHRSGAYAGTVARAAEITRAAVLVAGAEAIGEIGLDYHYDLAPKDVQRQVFAAQVAIAVELGKPVVIHTREATDDTIAVLKSEGAGRVRGVMHCFTGTLDEARQALDIGFLISLLGILTFPKAEALRDLARYVPADRLLAETDAPFLAPVPHRGQRNEPGWVSETFAALATARDETRPAIERQIGDNFVRFLGPADGAAPALHGKTESAR